LLPNCKGSGEDEKQTKDGPLWTVKTPHVNDSGVSA
jgi:hypothetical protein